jgi:hypothetical protein
MHYDDCSAGGCLQWGFLQADALLILYPAVVVGCVLQGLSEAP